jgi:Antibiotic biosynthesis monooxygenase
MASEERELTQVSWCPLAVTRLRKTAMKDRGALLSVTIRPMSIEGPRSVGLGNGDIVAFISTGDGCLTVFNFFEANTLNGQERLLEVMREIIDTAAYPGWISSTLHSGQDKLDVANYIQWRSKEDLDIRYAGEKFRNKTLPLFLNELTTSTRILKTEVVFTQCHPSLDDAATEISPNRDDYTLIIVFGVAPENQMALVDALTTQPYEWIMTVPGYRSHSIHRGIDGTFLVNYAQWSSKESFEAFSAIPKNEQPVDFQKARALVKSLVKSREANSYRVVHTRSAKK